MSFCKQCVYFEQDGEDTMCRRYPPQVGNLHVQPGDSCGEFKANLHSVSLTPNPEDAVIKRICDTAKQPGQGGLDLLCSSLALLVLRAQRGPR